MKITVLAGGISPERDVSLVSGENIAKALISNGHCVCFADLSIGINDLSDDVFKNNISDIKRYIIGEKSNYNKNEKSFIGKNIIELCKMSDAVFTALHGDIGENGKIQAMFDIIGIKYTGSGYDGCLLSMDKDIAKTIARSNGIKTPDWSINKYDEKIGFPCVIKPVDCGSSVGVSIVENMKETDLAVNSAENFSNSIMFEKKINGREFSVGVLGDKALPVIEIISSEKFYNYKSKYQKNKAREICPALIPACVSEKMQNIAVKMHTLLRMKYYSRTDFIVDGDDNIYFIETNSLPGMTPFSLLPQEAKACGISYNELCEKIIQSAFEYD